MSLQPHPSCLHCAIVSAIETYYEQHGERVGGNIRLDVSQAIPKLCEAIAELVHRSPSRAQRRQFERFSHKCLDAAFTAQVSGETVPVSVGPLEREH